jgi:hypothetical protein
VVGLSSCVELPALVSFVPALRQRGENPAVEGCGYDLGAGFEATISQ